MGIYIASSALLGLCGVCEVVHCALFERQVQSLAFVVVMIKAFICSLSQLPQWEPEQSTFTPSLVATCFVLVCLEIYFGVLVPCQNSADVPVGRQKMGKSFLSCKNVTELGGLAVFTGLGCHAC